MYYQDENEAKHPVFVRYKGRTYSRTGKFGNNVKTGEHSAEYTHTNYDADPKDRVERRLWRTLSGKIHED